MSLSSLSERRPVQCWVPLSGAQHGLVHLRLELKFKLAQIIRAPDIGPGIDFPPGGRSMQVAAEQQVASLMELME